jgi:hypothetical protein
MKKSIHSIFVLILILSLSSCENYLGDKTDLGFIELPEFTNRDVAYVPIQPPLKGFVRPIDICIGFDELLYVVDEATEEVICFDESGLEIGRKYVQGARAVSQDRRFNLLVIGTKTDSVAGVEYELSCIYRLELLNDNGYGLNQAQVTNTIVHPFYFKSTFSSGDALVQFHKVGIIGDNFDPNENNAWYVTRTGPSSNNAGLGPDDAVIQFNNDDQFQSAIVVNTSGGQFNDFFKQPSGLITLCQPPQISAGTGKDFLATSLEPNNLLKVQYIEFQETDFGAQYSPRIFSIDTSLADGFISEPNKFSRPSHMTLTGDGTNYLFVSDSDKDSVYQFTLTGLEGIPPPPASGETKYQKASFGGNGIGLSQFNEPMGVAYWSEILYVCDAGNARVLRFKLTLDFE